MEETLIQLSLVRTDSKLLKLGRLLKCMSDGGTLSRRNGDQERFNCQSVWVPLVIIMQGNNNLIINIYLFNILRVFNAELGIQ